MLRASLFETSAGFFVLAGTDQGVCGAVLPVPSRTKALRLAGKRWPDAELRPELFAELQERITAYFAGEPVRFHTPFDLSGQTAFRRRVLRACARIPYGRTRTYGALAREIGAPRAARAVGGAMAANPIPLLIPCHRVLAANNRMGGFSAEGGVGVKRRMLELEGVTV